MVFFRERLGCLGRRVSPDLRELSEHRATKGREEGGEGEGRRGRGEMWDFLGGRENRASLEKLDREEIPGWGEPKERWSVWSSKTRIMFYYLPLGS